MSDATTATCGRGLSTTVSSTTDVRWCSLSSFLRRHYQNDD